MGVSARAALHHARGELAPGTAITIESILGTCFEVQVTDTCSFGCFDAVIPEVSGTAHITRQSEFYLDPTGPLKHGSIVC